jgi:hypothetical protein
MDYEETALAAERPSKVHDVSSIRCTSAIERRPMFRSPVPPRCCLIFNDFSSSLVQLVLSSMDNDLLAFAAEIMFKLDGSTSM